MIPSQFKIFKHQTLIITQNQTELISLAGWPYPRVSWLSNNFMGYQNSSWYMSIYNGTYPKTTWNNVERIACLYIRVNLP